MISAAGRSRARLGQAFLRDMRSPEWGLVGQGLRFVLAAGVVGSVYVSVTIVLHDLLLVSFQVALASGFLVSVAVHFTLQRVFVWRHHAQFALAVGQQALRYLPVAGAQYAFSALCTSYLPGLLGLPVDVVYAMTIVAVATFNFQVLRSRVFHPGPTGPGEL